MSIEELRQTLWALSDAIDAQSGTHCPFTRSRSFAVPAVIAMLGATFVTGPQPMISDCRNTRPMKTTVRMRDLKAGDVLLDGNHQPWIRVVTATRSKKDGVVVVRGDALQAGGTGWTSGHSMTNVNIRRGE